MNVQEALTMLITVVESMQEGQRNHLMRIKRLELRLRVLSLSACLVSLSVIALGTTVLVTELLRR